MGLKNDLEGLFLDTEGTEQLMLNATVINKLIKDTSISQVTDCIDAINEVHKVIVKAEKNPELQKLAKQLVKSSTLLNVLRLIINEADSGKVVKDDGPKAAGDESPFDLPLVKPKGGKITPTKAK